MIPVALLAGATAVALIMGATRGTSDHRAASEVTAVPDAPADARLRGAGRTTPRPVAGPAAMVRLRVEADGDGDGDGARILVDNLLAGAIEVMIHADGASPPSDPPLPARGTVPAYSASLLARIARGQPRLRVEVVPGTPNARPRDVEYGYPLQTASLRVQQAWGGGYSHADDANRHAVDFAVPVGTPVLAARDGVVMQSAGDFEDAVPGEGDATRDARANFIRVLHDDGSMALYAHLQAGGVLVNNGQRVRRGEAIGLSGNSGRSTAPHLHFVVQVNRGMRLASLPFRMFGPHGILRFGDTQAGGD